jgi:2-aminomuconate deaminase
MSQKIETYVCPEAPAALGAYSHAVGYGDLLFVAGIASRDPVTNQIPGIRRDAEGRKIGYDITAETRATLENIRSILEFSGSDFEHVLEVNVYLLDMKDFAGYNAVYAEYFPFHKPARTTVGVSSLPGEIAIEMKMVAVKRPAGGETRRA